MQSRSIVRGVYTRYQNLRLAIESHQLIIRKNDGLIIGDRLQYIMCNPVITIELWIHSLVRYYLNV